MGKGKQQQEKKGSFLGKVVRVKVTDERFFAGTIQCYDSHGNIILGNVIEARPYPSGTVHRNHALLSIPFEHIVRMDALKA